MFSLYSTSIFIYNILFLYRIFQLVIQVVTSPVGTRAATRVALSRTHPEFDGAIVRGSDQGGPVQMETSEKPWEKPWGKPWASWSPGINQPRSSRGGSSSKP